MTDDDRAPDLAESWALIESERERARRSVRVDERVVYGVWALAWGVGYLALFVWAGPEGQPGLPGPIVFGVLIVAAIVVTVAHIEGRTRGTGGPDAETNAMLGWAWPLGFIGSSLTAGAIGRAGIEGDAAAIVYNGLPCLVVACLYMGTGAALRDRRQLVLGGWIAVTVGIASFIGGAHLYLAMAVLGGGGFAVATVAAARDRAGRS
ncbi:hypothetical protein GCM10008944_13810 [Cytobacillus oceanisediminis]